MLSHYILHWERSWKIVKIWKSVRHFFATALMVNKVSKHYRPQSRHFTVALPSIYIKVSRLSTAEESTFVTPHFFVKFVAITIYLRTIIYTEYIAWYNYSLKRVAVRTRGRDQGRIKTGDQWAGSLVSEENSSPLFNFQPLFSFCSPWPRQLVLKILMHNERNRIEIRLNLNDHRGRIQRKT